MPFINFFYMEILQSWNNLTVIPIQSVGCDYAL